MKTEKRNGILKGTIACLCATALAVVLCACSSSSSTSETSDESSNSNITIKVGSKSFTEQLILGEITMDVLEEAGYSVEDKTNVDGSAACYSALTSGEFDVYWEYLGTLWQGVLLNDTVYDDIDELYAADQEAVAEDGITMLDVTPMNSTYAIGITQDLYEQTGIETYSDLAAYIQENPGACTFACNEEFTTRTDCYLGLIDTYGMDFGDDNIITMDMGLVYDALEGGDANVGMLFVCDGRINDYDFILLEDDQNFFPIYNGTPMVRDDLLEEAPEVADILNEVAALITDDVMRELCHTVDVDGAEPSEAAYDWCVENGLIEAEE